MKIQSVPPSVQQLNRVREKDPDSGAGNGRQEHEQHEKKDQEKKPEVVATSESVDAAIEDFKHDVHNLAHGLNVDRIGHGPGLRVVLKDESGTVVRQLTGEEFLRLREGARLGPDGRRGRVLDQKA